MAEAYQCDACDEYKNGEPDSHMLLHNKGYINMNNDQKSTPVLNFCGDCIEDMEDQYQLEIEDENFPDEFQKGF